MKGQAQPLAVYRVLYESMARSRLEAAGSTGWTPLVGREQEIGLLLERWAGQGGGRAGGAAQRRGRIGNRVLVQVLQEHVSTEPQAWLTPCQCSPYYQNTALYPLIDLLERVALRFEREESPQQKLRKLEGFVVQYGLPLAEAVPSCHPPLLPLTADYAPLTMSPEQQKQQTLHALLTIFLRIAAQQPGFCHGRPALGRSHHAGTAQAPGGSRSHHPYPRPVHLSARLQPTLDGACPPHPGHGAPVTPPPGRGGDPPGGARQGFTPEVVEQIVAKTDGVPLFVEELTKMVLESGLLQEWDDRYELTSPLPPLAIPATLHDSLMARLDRLATVKGLAQLGATLGREFSYELLRAVSPDEATVQRGLHQLVEAEFLYQQGCHRRRPPALQACADPGRRLSVAAQEHPPATPSAHCPDVGGSVPETVETQPSWSPSTIPRRVVPSRRCTTGSEQANASDRSAHLEAISHVTTGIDAQDLPATPARAQHELTCTSAGRGLGLPRARRAQRWEHASTPRPAGCVSRWETPEMAPPMRLYRFYAVRLQLQTARELGARLLRLAQGADPGSRCSPTMPWGDGITWVHCWPPASTWRPESCCMPAQPDACIPPRPRPREWPVAFCRAHPVVTGISGAGTVQPTRPWRWRTRLRIPLVWRVRRWAAFVHQFRHDVGQHAQADDILTLATTQGFTQWAAVGTLFRGGRWPCTVRGRRGWPSSARDLAALAGHWSRTEPPLFLDLACRRLCVSGRTAEGLQALEEAPHLLEQRGMLVGSGNLSPAGCKSCSSRRSTEGG